jgi:molecular chaperone HscB
VDVREGLEPKADPGFLMEMMEQREALSEAKAKGDKKAAARLGEAIREREKVVMRRLVAGFESPKDAEALLPLLGELRYYRRFLDEVSAIEDHEDAP